MIRILVFIASSTAAFFVLLLGSQLPDTVASHFGLSGKADGSMSRDAFVAIMCVVTAATPSLVWWVQDWATRHKKLSIPEADYWLAAERIETTREFINKHGALLSVMLAVFLAYNFWLVSAANIAASEPGAARLNITLFLAGLAVFLALVAAWLV